MRTRYRLLILAALTLLAAGCDQATKQIAGAALKASPPHAYLGGLFRLQYSENPGAFLSLGAGLSDNTRLWIFMVGVGLLLVAVLAFALLARGLRPPTVAALGLFLGGGFSNWADRLAHGNVVVDFMNMGIGPVRTGIFNVADLCVVAGAVLLFATELFSSHRPRHIASEASAAESPGRPSDDEHTPSSQDDGSEVQPPDKSVAILPDERDS